MSGFYSKCLVNVDDLIGVDIADTISDVVAAYQDKHDFQGLSDELNTLLNTKTGIQKIMHDPKYIEIKIAVQNILASALSDAMNDDENGGNICGCDYYVSSYDAIAEIADHLILGSVDPDKLIAFAESMAQETASAAKGKLVRTGLFGETINDKFLAKNGPGSIGADDMYEAFALLGNQFGANSYISYYDGMMKNFPEDSVLENIKTQPVKYAVVTLLFK